MQSGLRFFGKITAMISHELKNSLAIMNENTGLLDDLLLMEKKGLPINSDRLNRLSADMEKQIDRSNEIIQNLNSFAHSIDEPVQNFSAGDSISLFIKISKRLAVLNNFEIRHIPDNDLQILGNQFDFLNLLWNINDKLIENISDLNQIVYSVDTERNSLMIKLDKAIRNTELQSSIFASEEIKLLTERLKLDIILDHNIDTIKLIV